MSFRQSLKSKRYNCEDCGKSFIEKELDIKRDLPDGGRIENEFVPKCRTCFRKALKKYRKQGWLQQQVMNGMLSVPEMAEYAKGNMCEGKLNEIIRSRKNNPLPVPTKESLIKEAKAVANVDMD